MASGNIYMKYQLPPSAVNNTSNTLFVDDLTETNKQRPDQQNTIILWDFNIHMDNLKDKDSIAFNNTMEGMGLEQHISGPTHIRKYIAPSIH